MAAPGVKKEIATSPSSNAVTNPTDPKLKAKDIDRKMRLYGAIEALRKGNYPSNEQIEATLSYVEKHSPVDEKKLSKDGRKLVSDCREIIANARKLVLKKNEDELLQNFLYHSRHVDSDKVDPTQNVKTAKSKGDVKADGEQAAEHLRVIAKLIFTNAEFRKLMKDISLIGRDVAADAAQKAANKARPNQERLDQVDKTAPSNQWHGPDGEKRGPNQSVPDTGLAEKKDQLRDAKQQFDGVKEQAKEHGRDAANRAAGSAQERPGEEGGAAKDALAQKADEVVPEEQKQQAQGHADDVSNAVDAAIAKADGPHDRMPDDPRQLSSDEQRAAKEAGKGQVSNKIKSAIPEQHREKVDKTKDYLNDKIPPERRERFIYRAKKVIVEQQRHQDYQKAIEWLLSAFENYKGHAEDVASQTKGHAQSNVQGDSAFSKAQLELRTLVERFANNTSCQPIIECLETIYVDANHDKELKEWFRKFDKYIRKVLQEPGFIMKDQCNEEGRRLRDDDKGFFSERYAPHREALFNETKIFFTAFADDPLNKQFGKSWKKLTTDLLLNGEGDFTYKSHLWTDVRKVIAPQLLQGIGYVPIPRIEYSDPTVDLVIENLTLEAQNLLPNIFEIDARTYHKLSPYKGIDDKSRQSVWMQFSQIQTDLRDVAFYVHKKTGFPRISESGLADVFIGGNGISGKIHLESSSKRGSIYKVKDVTVKIDTMKFKIRRSNHNFLYAILRPLATGLIKKQIAKALQDAIRSGLVALDAQLVEIRDRLDEAKDDDETSRVDVLKAIFKEKTRKTEKQSDGTFQVVAKRESRIIDWTSKDSMLEKQAEREAKAGKGAGWKSLAFDIVPGSSTDTQTPSKGITSQSNVPTRTYKKENPDGSGAISKPTTKAGAATAGTGTAGAYASSQPGGKSPSQSPSKSADRSAGSANPNGSNQVAAGAVSGAAVNAPPLAPNGVAGAGATKVTPQSNGAPAAGSTTGLPPPVHH